MEGASSEDRLGKEEESRSRLAGMSGPPWFSVPAAREETERASCPSPSLVGDPTSLVFSPHRSHRVPSLFTPSHPTTTSLPSLDPKPPPLSLSHLPLPLPLPPIASDDCRCLPQDQQAGTLLLRRSVTRHFDLSEGGRRSSGLCPLPLPPLLPSCSGPLWPRGGSISGSCPTSLALSPLTSLFPWTAFVVSFSVSSVRPWW